MRTIKFRAWDKNREVMMPNIEIEQRYDTTYFHPNARDEVELMQFTGLGSNGQEWYEGDILENDGDWYEIVWDSEGQWRASGIGATGENLQLGELVSSETWVQGNVHQNPELLQVN